MNPLSNIEALAAAVIAAVAIAASLYFGIEAHALRAELATAAATEAALNRDLGIEKTNVATLSASLSEANAAVERLHASAAEADLRATKLQQASAAANRTLQGRIDALASIAAAPAQPATTDHCARANEIINGEITHGPIQ